MKVWAWAAAKATKSYKHTYGTLADSQHSDDDLRPYHPNYGHSYVCPRAI